MTTTKKWAIAVAMVLFCLSQTHMIAQSATQSNVSFTIRNAGLSVDGKFEKFTTDVLIDFKSPPKSRFNGVIEVSSINTGIDMRDKDLKKKEYFYADSYPNITFKSTSIFVISPTKVQVTGNLTMRDVTKKISFDVNISTNGNKNVYAAEVKLNRRDYKVGGSSWILSDDLVAKIVVVQ